jgi:hypothetical protein
VVGDACAVNARAQRRAAPRLREACSLGFVLLLPILEIDSWVSGWLCVD